MDQLKKFGITERFLHEASVYEGCMLARVVAQYKGLYKVVTPEGETQAEVSGKFRHATAVLSDFPTVGDYVMVTLEAEGRAVIHHLLTRKSAFLRSAVGVSEQAQVVAANIDIIFICMSLNNNYNLNRLERYIAIAFESGAMPVIVLTKADLCENLDAMLSEVEKVSAYSDILITSLHDENRASAFAKYLGEGVTAAFIGSSGVGKSTLINDILGNTTIATREIDKNDKGKHTTTGREMFPTSYGGVVIDTPGMRELGIESADINTTFADIETYAQSCKFTNCSHTNEPQCAVLAALSEGHIDERRLESYFKIKIESGYVGLSSKEIEEKKLERMFKEVGGMKNARKAIKNKKKFL